MNVLFFLNTKKKFFDNQLGGIETLNKELFDYLKKSKIDFKKIIIVNRISKILYKIKWDAIISSNNARIFDKLNSQNKILWMHNVLQVEKAIRKKQLLPILRNKITAVFNSHYLKKKTSFFYFFKKKKVISNFLSQKFYNLKIDYKRKPYFIWSVQRTKGLDRIIHYWSKNIYLNNNKAKLYIFGVSKSDAAKLSIKDFKKYNIYYMGKVKKDILIKYYKKSSGMICLGFDETFCLNAIEGLSCGLPLITFGYTGLKEIVNNKNSFLIKNYQDFLNAIDKILYMNNKDRVNLIEYCVNFSQKYHIKKIAPKWIDVLNLKKNDL